MNSSSTLRRQSLEKYFQNELKWGRSPQAKIVFEFLVKASEFAENGVVLDAGAGHQRYKPFFQRSLYLAQEHPEAGVRNKKISKYDILSDAKHIPLLDNCVDLILSTSSLEHMRAPDAFFREAYRVLKPGGALFINVPFIYPEHETPFDFQRPTRYGIERWYDDSGFTDISIRPTSSSIYTAAFLQKYVVSEFASAAHGVASKALGLGLKVFVRIMTDLALLILDQGPQDYTEAPIGWISTARKAGHLSRRESPPDRDGFLKANQLSQYGYFFENGHIQPDGGQNPE